MARVGIMSGAFNPGAFGSGGFGGGWGAAPANGGGAPNGGNGGNGAIDKVKAQEEALKAELRKMSTVDLFKAVASAQAGTALYSAIRSVLVWRLAKYVAIVAAVAGVSYGGYYWYKNGKKGKRRNGKKHAAESVEEV